MRLTILSVAYPLFPVGPGSGGGAEQILQILDSALVMAGHRSIVIAAKGSEVSGELVETSASRDEITDEIRQTAQQHHRNQIKELLDKEDIDLIHFHGLDFLSYRPSFQSVRQLATLHLPVTWYPEDLFRQENLTLNCVSASQARSHARTRLSHVISNGINLHRFGSLPGKTTISLARPSLPRKRC